MSQTSHGRQAVACAMPPGLLGTFFGCALENLIELWSDESAKVILHNCCVIWVESVQLDQRAVVEGVSCKKNLRLVSLDRDG
jgi:hypothetical protein